MAGEQESQMHVIRLLDFFQTRKRKVREWYKKRKYGTFEVVMGKGTSPTDVKVNGQKGEYCVVTKSQNSELRGEPRSN